MSEYNPLQQPAQYGGVQRQVSFGEAVKMGLQRYASFAGRSSRSEYWWWCLFSFLVGIGGSIVAWVVGDWFSYLLSFALLIPNISVACRRLHDIGKAAGYYFLIFIPLVGAIILLIWFCKESEPQANRFGEVPNVQ